MPSTPSPLTSITLLTSPYHDGLPANPLHRTHVSLGPDYILSSGLPTALSQRYTLPIHTIQIPPIPATFEGDIARTFELLRRISLAVTTARKNASFPILLAGDCCGSVGVAAGLWASHAASLKGGQSELGCVWFDAHDDYNTPDTLVSGYFDGQAIAMMAGECWRGMVKTVPGFRDGGILLRRVVHCGMRDVNEVERERVEGSDMGVVWGDVKGEVKVDFEGGLRRELLERFGEGGDVPMLVHLDLDALDSSLGKANAFACPGGLFEEDLLGCIKAISERTVPLAFTIASFDPQCDGEESAQRIVGIAIKAAEGVLDGLKKRGLLGPGSV